ncbi:MAG: VWA domain-containing protein [Hahellaceae bacterium]|jgi:Ca-activated chloride channel family protein|nr:VWA domain-containing protein [Hahellaceae bacterium]
MLTFAWWWFVTLLPLPFIMQRLRSAERANEPIRVAVRVPFYQEARQAAHGQQPHQFSRRRWATVLLWFTWITLVTGLMRPQWVGEPIAQTSKGRDLLMAIDISPSMQETDLLLNNRQVPRLQVVKRVAGEFIRAREGDRVGLILFGAQPYIQAPLTYDRDTVDQLLQEAGLGMAGNATAIGDAIGLAIKRLRDRPAESRIMILLTDGANTGGEVSPEQAAKLAAEAGIKVYTIGVGADEVLRRSLFGIRKENPSADLDETLLKSIADQTGGEYFRAKSTGELEMIYEAINQLEPVEQAERFFRPVTEYHWVPALASLLGLLLTSLLNAFRRTP